MQKAYKKYFPIFVLPTLLAFTLFFIIPFIMGIVLSFCKFTAIRYHDSDSWPAHPPVGMWFNYGVLNDFLKEWTLRKEELKSGKITRDEYFEWKINWPQTCDDCGKREPSDRKSVV